MASLSSVRLPSDAFPVMRRLLELDEQVFNSLSSALSGSLSRSLTDLKRSVREAVGSTWTTDEEVDAFVKHLTSISSLSASHNFDPSELAETIGNLVSKEFDGEQDSAKLASRLEALLRARNFLGFSKAVDVSTEYDQVLHLTRIVTDIRPVFDQKPGDDPIGSVLVHNFRVDYFHEGRVKTTTFAMNGHDLNQLKDVVDRALQKSESLSRFLDKSSLPQFDITGDDGK